MANIDLLEQKYAHNAQGSLSQVLDRSRARMSSALRRHIPLIYKYFNLINIAAPASVNSADQSDSKHVSANLLARIANDLLAIANLCADGLVVQAAAIASSTYECAVTIGAIGSDDSEAERWLNHTDLTKSIETIAELTRRTRRNLNLSLELYEFYSWLCAPKHSNPVTQKRVGRDRCPRHAFCTAQFFFPTASHEDQDIAGEVIETTLIMTGIALMSFLNNHMDENMREEFVEIWNQLDAELDTLLALR